MRRYVWLLAVTLVSAGRDGALASQTPHRESPLQIFATLGLTPEEVAAVDSGRPVAKVLSWGTPSEVYVFGAIHVDAASDIYVKSVRDIARLTTMPGYLAVGELRDDATVADLTALVLEADDAKALKNCKEGSCDVQLPAATIDAFHDRVDWSRPNAAEQVNHSTRMIVSRARLRRSDDTSPRGFAASCRARCSVSMTAPSERIVVRAGDLNPTTH